MLDISSKCMAIFLIIKLKINKYYYEYYYTHREVIWSESHHSGTLKVQHDITRALRAHTPCAPCLSAARALICSIMQLRTYFVDDLYLQIRGQLCT